jgi:hypothetical protein
MPSSVSSNMTPVSEQSAQTTPASSPSPSDHDTSKEAAISDAMKREEEAMARKAQKEQAQRDDVMEKERKKDLEAGSETVDKKFKALEYLLNQSKVHTSPEICAVKEEM